MPSPSLNARSGWRALADKAGMAASTACAIHCALTPLVLAFLPALSGWALGLESLHGWMVVSLSVLAVAATWLGWRRHRKFYAWAFLVPGIGFLMGSHAFHGTAEHVLLAIGGTLIASAHLVNLRLAHGHVHDACCKHGNPT